MICDLRSEFERRSAVDRWPIDAEPPRLYLDIRNDARAGHGELIETIRKEPNPAGVHRGMMLIYRGMAAAFAPVLPQFFSHLLEPRHFPVVIHCHAGKDRTGFICAIVLAALGVPHRHIVADYLLTAERLDRKRLSVDLVETFSAFVGVPLTRRHCRSRWTYVPSTSTPRCSRSMPTTAASTATCNGPQNSGLMSATGCAATCCVRRRSTGRLA